MNLLIEDADLLDVKNKIIQNVINNFFTSGRLINALKCFAYGRGYGDEKVSFTYWSDLDEYDNLLTNLLKIMTTKV